MNTCTDLRLADGTRPTVGAVIFRTNEDARHTFIKIVKVNRKSLICQMVVAHTARNHDGSLFGITPNAQYGWLYVTAGDAYGDTFKITTVDRYEWAGQPVPAHRIDLNSYTGNNIWKVA